MKDEFNSAEYKSSDSAIHDYGDVSFEQSDEHSDTFSYQQQQHVSAQSNQAELPPYPRISKYYRIKWFVDVIIVVLTSWFIVPVILISMILVRLTSRGPIFYTQTRCGINGKLFKMIKIRSMVIDAENGKPKWSRGNDPRVTTVGRIMRKLHIDEMPQIINVLRGEMTVIGPRPERPEFVKKLKTKIQGYEYRMCVLPGLTGYAQVNWQADNGLEDVQRKLILDLEYIEDVNIWFDFRILLATIKFPRKLCGVYQIAENSRWSNFFNLHNEHESVILSSSHNVNNVDNAKSTNADNVKSTTE
ncbi:MAG: sugar transferase [Planctomycetaceae bacterium]|jgi:lipopolysaccharide/colanic/teichoic acid biosynthesis glycosyltransferase|nr:sugar transferase [Planctomycetaceae bacterium]